MNRLERLTGDKKSDGGTTQPGEGSRADEIRALRERVDALLSRRSEERGQSAPPSGRSRGVPLEELVPGAEASSDAGVFFCSHRLAGATERHALREPRPHERDAERERPDQLRLDPRGRHR